MAAPLQFKGPGRLKVWSWAGPTSFGLETGYGRGVFAAEIGRIERGLSEGS